MISKSLRCGSDRIGSVRSVLLVICLLFVFTSNAKAQSISNNITVSGATCPNGGSADANCVTFAVPADSGTLTFSITGTWTGTISFEYKTINSAYAAMTMVNTTSLAAVTSTTANGNWVSSNPGYTFIRMRASATITGTAVAVIKATSPTSVLGITFGGTSGTVTTTTDLTGINGVAPSVSSGNTGTGVLRIIEATDSLLNTNTGAISTSVTSIDAKATTGNTNTAAIATSTASLLTAFNAATTASTPILANALDDNPLVTVKSSAGVLDSYYCYNGTGAVAYVQFLDATSPSLGSTTPKWSIAIPAGGAANLSNANLSFANAIKVASTTTATGSTGAVTDCNFGAH